ncbi:MAG: patatin-like phospholipase family protein, partial [Muribaculaceae bacterium]|nr:patatin-like phospholipase family protein [Muribaculaceae bacterium]
MLIYPIKSYSAPELSNLTDTLRPMSVGLVLSGGGAKGIAHIGVIQALEDNNIPIDYVVGTSMGAIVGGLYAAGYTPAEMMELLESKDFANWSTGQINESLTYYFFKHNPTPAMLN